MTKNEIADEILRSKKYADIDRAAVERISAETIPKYGKQKDIVKAVKKELHIIHESFFPDECHLKAGTLLNSYTGSGVGADKDLAARLMALHASTKERLRQAVEIYGFISGYFGKDDDIVDLGCGFCPFALPFYNELPKSYLAYDISSATIKLLDRYFKLAGLPYSAEICDAAAKTPGARGSVLLMLKLYPVLERQKQSRAFEVMQALGCATSIISFPLKSASGREKGMEAFYATRFEKGLPAGFTVVKKEKFANEMFYVVSEGAPGSSNGFVD